MNCKCGEVLSNSMSPNDIQLRLYTDKEWDSIMEKDTIETWKIPLPAHDVWKCPNCKRIYIFEDGVDKPAKIYNLEQ